MPDDLWTVYDSMAGVYESQVAGSAYNAHYERPALLSILGDVSGKRVLDAACGPGLLIEQLVSRGASVVGFDASGEMVELASRRVSSERATVLRAVFGERRPLADSGFDLVVWALAIYYADDRSAAFSEFFRVVRAGGAVVFSTHHPTAEWLRDGGSYFDVRRTEQVWARADLSYTVRFWRESLTSLCAAATDAGFVIEKLIEPLPADSMRDQWPESWEKLNREPGFLIMRLLRPLSG
jgi:ubiquinone/menaquinone biosynthesis C-methylase UbiE